MDVDRVRSDLQSLLDRLVIVKIARPEMLFRIERLQGRDEEGEIEMELFPASIVRAPL